MLSTIPFLMLLACASETPAPAENVDQKSTELSNKSSDATDASSAKKSEKSGGKVEGKEEEKAVKVELADPAPELLAPEKAVEQAPAKFSVRFVTTQGNFVIDVDRSWSPVGADRFYNLVKIGYFEDVAFFRAIKGFMVQFGIHGHPDVNNKWRSANIQDDPVVESNLRGMLTFAKSGAPNSRSTQFFINLNDNANLDKMGFSPIGKISEEQEGGMGIVDKLYTGYGEGAPRGRGPNQMYVQTKGNPYLKESFPKLDYIKSAELLK